MRIAISALVGMSVALGAALASAQPAPPPPPPPAPVPAAQPPGPPIDAVPPPAAPPSDAPPPPPKPGTDLVVEPPPPLAPVFPVEGSALPSEAAPPLAGWHGAFFVRDPKDYFRIYPKLRINYDVNSSFGSGVNNVAAADGGNGLKARLFLRRLTFELGGEFMKRWTFNGGFEVTQPISNANGKTETSAAKAGVDPTADTARYAAVQAVTPGIQAADVYINYTAAPWMNFMIGQYNTPFSMENRTSDKYTALLERSIAVRAFARTSVREIGVTAWGEVGERRINYEIGLFSGDGQNRPQIDNSVDVIGRVFVRPLSPSKDPLSKLQIGISAAHGERDPKFVGYDYSPITTGQGFTLWNTTYTDSLGRQIHILPSGSQNEVGAELRVPVSIFDIKGEVFYVNNGTREGVDGFQLTNIERLGSVKGTSWYAQVSAWPLGEAFVYGDPDFFRPTRLDFTKEAPRPKKGLELIAQISGINATYDGASRGGTYDAKTPGEPTSKVGKDISVYQFGFGITYWHTSYIRVSVNYAVYDTPGSGTSMNLAGVPGNLGKTPVEGAHLLHELGGRVGVAF